jgi:hypothetical protein
MTSSGISAASMRRRKLLKERLSCITNEENARRAGNSGGLAMSYKLALAGAGLALSLLMDSANANTVTIELQEAGVNGGAITPVATGDGSAGIAGLTYGTFSSIFVNGVELTTIRSALFSNVIAASSSTIDTLTVYVELSGASLPGFFRLGSPLLSSFTSNFLPPNWTAKEEAYATFTSFTQPLGSSTFNTIGTAEQFGFACFGGEIVCVGTLTEKYTITTASTGSFIGARATNDTIDVQVPFVPGPIAGAGLPGLILAGGLLGWWRHFEPVTVGLRKLRRYSETASSRSFIDLHIICWFQLHVSKNAVASAELIGRNVVA